MVQVEGQGDRAPRLGRNGLPNDLPDCPHGGLLLGTNKTDKIRAYGGSYLGDKRAGEEGDDEIRGLGANDQLYGGKGSDVIYGGDGDDVLWTGSGEDVLNGGDGNDVLQSDIDTKQRDKLYCGKGKDRYVAEKHDYVDSSCETNLGSGGRAD